MILVTGGTGIVGAHILFELVNDGIPVRALQRDSSSNKVVEDLFKFYSPKGAQLYSKIEWIEGDLTDIQSLESALKGCESVFHAAAFVSFEKANFKKLQEVNSNGTANLINVALKSEATDFYYVSSVAAIGRDEKTPVINENVEWETSDENTGYAVSKHAAEMEVWRGGEEGLNIAIVNPTIVLGPGRTHESSGTLFKSVKNNQRFFTLGENGFVDARDVAFVLKRLHDSKKFAERFILVGENTTYKNIAQLMARHLGVKEPSKLAKPWLTGLAWRMLWLGGKLTGKSPVLTKESARSSHRKTVYLNDKVRNELGVTFRTAEQAINNASAFFREYPEHLS